MKTSGPMNSCQTPPPDSARPAEPCPAPPKKRVLVVDDDAAVTRLLKLNLEQASAYEVRIENAAPHAIRAAEEFRPDLILMDVLMPGIDGGQLAGRFQDNPKLKSIPIVFLTGTATKSEVRQRGGVIGGLNFLAKPVDVAELVGCLRRHLGQ